MGEWVTNHLLIHSITDVMQAGISALGAGAEPPVCGKAQCPPSRARLAVTLVVPTEVGTVQYQSTGVQPRGRRGALNAALMLGCVT